jgi:hypothetical protein
MPTWQSRKPEFSTKMDCFVSLAMTAGHTLGFDLPCEGGFQRGDIAHRKRASPA